MTTGRINQVTLVKKGLKKPPSQNRSTATRWKIKSFFFVTNMKKTNSNDEGSGSVIRYERVRLSKEYGHISVVMYARSWISENPTLGCRYRHPIAKSLVFFPGIEH